MVKLEAKDLKPFAITFHGFLGSPKDFNFLNTYFNVYNLDLRPQGNESWDNLVDRTWLALNGFLDENKLISNQLDFFVFSYSMGSKLLFSVFNKYENLLKSKSIRLNLVLLSTHFGLYENDNIKDELEFRTEMNLKFLKIINEQEVASFLKEWSRLSLFKADDVDQMLDTTWTKSQILHYFKFWNQSQTVNQADKLFSYDFIDSINLCYGDLDVKYKSQANLFKNNYNLESQIKVNHIELIGRSHRILKDSDFKFIIKKMGIKSS